MDIKIEYIVSAITFFFIVGILIVNFVGSANKLLVYGKNTSASSPPPTTTWEKFIDILSQWTVPKHYFVHYYIFFLLLMTELLIAIVNAKLDIIPEINDFIATIYYYHCVPYQTSSDNHKHLMIITALLTIQAYKRLYEDMVVSKFSDARMNVLHYVFGLTYYFTNFMVLFMGLMPYMNPKQMLWPQGFSIGDVISIVVAVLAQIDQFQNHCHLASLVKYTIPSFRLFKYCTSPHYLDEIVFYMVILGQYLLCYGIGWVKLNFILVWSVVVLNLGISAREGYKYYEEKFREEFNTGWRLIPFVW